jgi:hypothetical protein
MQRFLLQFFLERKQAGKNLAMVNFNWKYFLKYATLTAIHAHISLWNVFGHLPKKY